MAKDNRNLFCPGSEGQKSKIKVLVGLVPLVASEEESILCLFPSLWWLPATLGSHWPVYYYNFYFH